MKAKIITSAFLFFAGSLHSLQATPKAATQADTLLRMPAWMSALSDNPENVNYHDMVQKFNEFRTTLPNGGKKTPYNKAILNTFWRWQKQYAPYVGPDGTIRLPNQTAYCRAINEANRATLSRKKANGLNNNWQLVAPITTHDFQTKDAVMWQSNVQRFDIAPTNPNILYCGTETGMIFKTTDKGLNWTPCAPDHYFGGEISSVEIASGNSEKVLVGAGTMLWLTTDGGDTWTDITPLRPVSFQRIRDAVFDPADDNRIIMGSDDGLFLLEENGASWTKKLDGRCFDIKYHPADPNILYTITATGYGAYHQGMKFYKSTDRGYSFTEKSLGHSEKLASGRIGISEATTGEKYVYLLACEGTSTTHPFFAGKPYLFKSIDAGESWSYSRIGEKLNIMDREGSQGYYDMVITASATNPEHLLFGFLYLYSSSDGGQTLDTHKHLSGSTGVEIGGYYGKYNLHTDMQDIHVVRETGETWLSTDGGLAYSADFFKTTPQIRNRGIYASEFWGFDQGWNEDIIVGGRNHNGNIVRRASYGEITVSLGGSEVPTGYVFLSNPRKMAFSDTYHRLLAPENWKNTFENFDGWEKFLQYPFESTQNGIGFEYDPRYAESFLVVIGNYDEARKNLWRTSDDGESYVLMHRFDEPVSAHVIARSNPNKIIVATQGKIYSSTDAGATFTPYPLPIEITNCHRYKLAVHPRNENEIWVSTQDPGGIFKTSDDGMTWQKIDDGLIFNTPTGGKTEYAIGRFFLTGNEKNAAYAIANVKKQEDEYSYIFLGKVVYRDDTTNGWIDFSQGLRTGARINRILPFYKDGKVRIATDNGVWESALIDPHFTPVAQPLILNVGTGKNTGEKELQLDSYSIANQNGAAWNWKISPEPKEWLTSRTIRNPRIRIAANQSYDVTLTVTDQNGTSDSKTIHNMIKGSIDVPSSLTPISDKDVRIRSNRLHPGEVLQFIPVGFTEPLDVKIFDQAGQLIATHILTGTTDISTFNLKAGVYFYEISQNQFRKIGRFLIV